MLQWNHSLINQYNPHFNQEPPRNKQKSSCAERGNPGLDIDCNPSALFKHQNFQAIIFET